MACSCLDKSTNDSPTWGVDFRSKAGSVACLGINGDAFNIDVILEKSEHEAIYVPLNASPPKYQPRYSGPIKTRIANL